ncbi:MAG: hypothetical protein KIS66_11515 [Fimbriimonadaceae bacterium]|nr:hypothetical protein [Fimbriimonadaceae bacterium]
MAFWKGLKESRPGLKVLRQGSFKEDDLPRFSSDPNAEDPPMVGDETPEGKPVPPALESGFTHFMDGAQKVRAIAEYEGATIYLAHLSAALAKREERTMLTPSPDWYRGGLFLFVPSVIEDRHEFGRPGTWVSESVVVRDEDAARGFERVREVTVKAIDEHRNGLETQLLQLFRDGALLTDGTLVNAKPRSGDYPFVVGIVKSHSHQYFNSHERRRAILGLRTGERSGVFEVARGKDRDTVYSFYLRLVEADDRPALFGMIRVEIPPERKYLDRVDEIASWILAERAPTSRPDPRHDKLLYPIHWIEEYLRSRQPTDAGMSLYTA